MNYKKNAQQDILLEKNYIFSTEPKSLPACYYFSLLKLIRPGKVLLKIEDMNFACYG